MPFESAWRLKEEMISGDLDPVEHAAHVLERIRRWEGSVHAYLSLRREDEILGDTGRAVERLRSGKARPLEGLLVAVKDNIMTLDLPTTAASKMLKGFKPGYEATVVERLRAAGAIITGKTNMDEFAMGSTTELSAYGPTRNPVDLERVPGGSSGGSAAVLAYGGADLALGSDTGGSIRLPASFTGTVGLKPTYGAVSRYGLIPYANSLEQIGPMGRSVRDVALLFSVIAGWDPRDATTLRRTGWVDPENLAPLDPHSLRICTPEELLEGTDASVAKRFDSLLGELEESGAVVEEVRIPVLREALPAYYTIAMAEAASNLARYDGSLYPCRPSTRPRSWEELVERTRTECFGSEVKRRILMGVYVLSEGYRDQFYLAATRIRRLIRNAMMAATRRCIVASPTGPVPAPRLGERIGDPLKLYALDVQTVTANLAGIPSLSQPMGRVMGLPVGVQWMGPSMGEETLLRLGLLVEEVLGYGRG
ncbi:MAG: Asp-tRNA(Asn)/Glu-tRNA(Gln) amidotransferase subunit GatA [Desulfurococcales archaeon]|nr:Asp-tRNA(Asn)/Glu-tRNA(Gln) amidotransferase subunit GatA [Desulfurococcales archaeon]